MVGSNSKITNIYSCPTGRLDTYVWTPAQNYKNNVILKGIILIRRPTILIYGPSVLICAQGEGQGANDTGPDSHKSK